MHECFICCDIDGKSSDEKALEIFANRKYHSYPLVKLSEVYGCECKGLLAHNKCLLGIKKCPTCRKFSPKPNLYVRTFYDDIFGWIFKSIKSNPTLIKTFKHMAFTYVILMFGCYFLLYNKIIVVQSILYTSIAFMIILSIQLVGGICFIMEDYFVKYWLYDKKTNKILSLE